MARWRASGRRPKRGDPEIPRQEKVARATSPDEQESISVPAIVSSELFAQAAEQLEENRRRQRQQKQGAEHLLGGFESFAAGIKESLAQADFATRRTLLRMLIKRIEVDDVSWSRFLRPSTRLV